MSKNYFILHKRRQEMDGLTLAWKNCIDLYENKIIQIDKELKSFLS